MPYKEQDARQEFEMDKPSSRNCELCGRKMTKFEQEKYGMCTACLAEETFQQDYR